VPPGGSCEQLRSTRPRPRAIPGREQLQGRRSTIDCRIGARRGERSRITTVGAIDCGTIGLRGCRASQIPRPPPPSHATSELGEVHIWGALRDESASAQRCGGGATGSRVDESCSESAEHDIRVDVERKHFGWRAFLRRHARWSRRKLRSAIRYINAWGQPSSGTTSPHQQHPLHSLPGAGASAALADARGGGRRWGGDAGRVEAAGCVHRPS